MENLAFARWTFAEAIEAAGATLIRQSNLRAARFRSRPRSHRFADRFGVSGIVLVALDVGLHVLRWHRPQPVAKLREFTCLVMGPWRRLPCRSGTAATL